MQGRWTGRTIALVAGVAILAAGCGGDDAAPDDPGGAATTADEATTPTDDATTAPADDATATEAAAGVTITTAETDLGEILVDGDGRTLYLFDNDPEGESACDGGCAETWPPLTGEVAAGDGVDGALLGTIERSDGTTQATYAGMPLYYYAADAEAGDTTGQGVGGVWWVVGPGGERITAEASAASGY